MARLVEINSLGLEICNHDTAEPTVSTRTLQSPARATRMRSALAGAFRRSYASSALAFEVRGALPSALEGASSDEVIFILHGLLGSGRNWRSFSDRLRVKLLEKRGDRALHMVLVDLRGHGASASVGSESTSSSSVHAAALDVDDLARRIGVAPGVVIGHSLGGKVALEYSKLATTAPRQVWSLDSTPGRVVSVDTHGTGRVLEAIKRLPKRIPSRRWLAQALPQFSPALVDWIGSNLRNVPGSKEELEFIFNIETVSALFESFRMTDSWHAFEESPRADMHVVKAERSNAWSESCVERLSKTARSKFWVLPKADHWVHTSNPDGLLEMFASSIPEQ